MNIEKLKEELKDMAPPQQVINGHRMVIAESKVAFKRLRDAIDGLQNLCLDAKELKPEGWPYYFDILRTAQRRQAEFLEYAINHAYLLGVVTCTDVPANIVDPEPGSVNARTISAYREVLIYVHEEADNVKAAIVRFNA